MHIHYTEYIQNVLKKYSLKTKKLIFVFKWFPCYYSYTVIHFGAKSYFGIMLQCLVQNRGIFLYIINNIINDITIIRYTISSFLFALYFPPAGFRKLLLEFFSSSYTEYSNLQSQARMKMWLKYKRLF